MQPNVLDEMNWHQVKTYLDRRDVAVIPVGVLEARGAAWTIGYEYDVPLAFARLYAQQADAIVIPHVAHSFGGSTRAAVGTTHLSVVETVEFLTKIANTLVEQGFRRLVLISRHGPAHTYCYAFARDYFEATGILPLYLDLLKPKLRAIEVPEQGRRYSEDLFWAAEKMLKSGVTISAMLQAGIEASEIDIGDHATRPGCGRLAQANSEHLYTCGYFVFNEKATYDVSLIARTMQDVDTMAEQGMEVFNTWLEMVKPMETVEALAECMAEYRHDLPPRLEHLRRHYWAPYE